MEDYIFLDNKIEKGYYSIFLCGVKYRIKSKDDKRNNLKEKFLSMDSKNKPIILEENFTFSSKSLKFLSYDDIFMKNLKDIENLTAIFSDKVIIVHESISTAAELGMLAINEFITPKLCILIPDEYSIEENKMTSFLELAFFRELNEIELIKFYPEVEVWKSSNQKIDFRTKFFDNKIIGNLEMQLQAFLNKNKNDYINVNFRKCKYNTNVGSENIISYYLDSEKVYINISVQIIRAHIICFFNLDSFKSEIRKVKKLHEHITYIETLYKETLVNTIQEIEAKHLTNLVVTCKENKLEFRKVIAYTLYLLQAMDMISIMKSFIDDEVHCKISIKVEFEKIYCNYISLIKHKQSMILECNK